MHISGIKYVRVRLFRKFFFRQKYTNDMSIDAVFDGDYESAIFLVKIYTLTMKIVKYECILACNSSHFNNFIGINFSNYTHECSFS